MGQTSGGGAILPGVQILRALAALAVVVHHAELNVRLGFGGPQLFPSTLGAAGVDVFFVISGFIMLVSSRRLFATPGAGRTFLLRRLIRIVPVYWLVTSAYVAVFLLAPAAIGRTVSLGTVVASYLFWPFPGQDGQAFPILVVGWTLNYEMFFYLIFALVIALPQAWAAAAAIGALAVIVALREASGTSALPFAFWAAPLVLEFAAGIVLGLVFAGGWRLPRPAAAALVVAGILGFAWQADTHEPSAWMRLALWGLPATALVAGAALVRPSETVPGWMAPFIALGDASYSLYLVHLMVLTLSRIVAVRLGLVPTTVPDILAFIAASTLASVAVAWLSYAAFERPATRVLRGRLGV